MGAAVRYLQGMELRGSSRVKRRRVFYIPGYDPLPSRRYRELYRKESAKQAGISGYQIEMKPGDDPTSWKVRSKVEDAQTVARVDVLVWNDIVKQSMSSNLFATYMQLIGTAWVYLSTGALRRLSWLAKGPVLAALYPVLMLLGQLAIALVVAFTIGGVLAQGVTALLGLAGFSTDSLVVALTGSAVQLTVALPVALVILRWFKSKDDKLYAHYLMHDYAFTASRVGAYPPELESRLEKFRAQVSAALASDVDEVLIIGHSSGAQLAVSLVSDLIAAKQVPANGPALSLLTLGQVIPMVSFLPKADRLRRDLHRLAGNEDIAWVDISAPGDGCSFALSDPVAVTGVAPHAQRWPLVLSAAFSNTLSAETKARLKHRYFRLHFQYLCAFDRPGDYDYFLVTAGPVTLRERFRRRRASAQRIDVAASRFSTMVA